MAESSHLIIDEIFKYCFSLWGGRFSLIIPCKDGEPDKAFMPWLKAYDPDIVYSYVDLNISTQFLIHEETYPSYLQRHWLSDETKPRYIPNPAINPLAVSTLLPIAGAPNFFDGTRGIRLPIPVGEMKNDRFVTDSFGYPSQEIINLTRSVLSDNCSLLLVGNEDTYFPGRKSEADGRTSDAISLLQQLAHFPRIQSVARLAAMLAPRLDLTNHRWNKSYNIVIGDTIHDRVLYWNSRLLISPWRDGSDTDLCIPSSYFDNDNFVVELRNFMGARNQMGGGSAPHQATLRSTSLHDSDLEALADRLRRGQGWIAYDHEHVTDVADCTPESAALERQLFGMGQHTFRSPDLWIEQFASRSELRLSAVEPEHLRHTPPALANSLTGAWALDLDIERDVDHSPFTNVKHRWRLPRRLRTTQAFMSQYKLDDGSGNFVSPRVSSGGLLTIYSTMNFSIPKIRIPEDTDAIITAFQSGRDWASFHRFRRDASPPERLCAAARRSSAGRYFWGVYQLFDGMNNAREFLLHEFWRKQLQRYGATDQRGDLRHERVRTQIRKRLGTKILDLKNAEQAQRLADIVLQEADAERMTVRSISWSEFDADLTELATLFEANHPPHPEQEYNKAEDREWYQASLRNSVQTLCSLGVLHQGYEHACPRCLHKSWIAISDLEATVACEVCGDDHPAPVDKSWQFRLNGFLREALQRHGIGPLFWVLGRFQRHSGSSFWFEGPLNIFFDDDAALADKPATDIDLTMIDNGMVRMCEVKQSERQFTDPEGLACTMLKLRPDIAMVAIMEEYSDKIQRKFARFSKILEQSGIKSELITLDSEVDINRSPYF